MTWKYLDIPKRGLENAKYNWPDPPIRLVVDDIMARVPTHHENHMCPWRREVFWSFSPWKAGKRKGSSEPTITFQVNILLVSARVFGNRIFSKHSWVFPPNIQLKISLSHKGRSNLSFVTYCSPPQKNPIWKGGWQEFLDPPFSWIRWDPTGSKSGELNGKYQINDYNRLYCWWFRNPAKTHLGCFWNPANNGMTYQPQLVSRISEPSTVSWVSDLIGFDALTLNQPPKLLWCIFKVPGQSRYLCFGPLYIHGRLFNTWCNRPFVRHILGKRLSAARFEMIWGNCFSVRRWPQIPPRKIVSSDYFLNGKNLGLHIEDHPRSDI